MTSQDLLSPELARTGPEPLHEQIARRIRRSIGAGLWPPHYKLPAEPQLAEQFEVSRGTIRRALRSLLDDRLLVQVQGKGTFVAAAAATIEQPIAQELLSIAEALRQQGMSFRTEVLSSGRTVVPDGVAALLGVPAMTRTFAMVRRRSVEGQWVALLRNHVRLDLCPGVDRYDYEERTLFSVIEQECGCRLEWARRTFEAQAAEDEVAEQLEVPLGSPVLFMEQVTYLPGDTPIEYSDVWVRGDRFKLSSLLRRIP